jgi:hypothetical protein
MPKFTFTAPRSLKARQYLEKRVAYLAAMNRAAQAAYLAGAIVTANRLPVDADCDNFDKTLVVSTLRRWLEQVSKREAA